MPLYDPYVFDAPLRPLCYPFLLYASLICLDISIMLR
jgi:hypothetical protein